MPRSTYTQSNFTGGELSPKLLGRGDASNYQNGFKIGENVTIAIQGGLDGRDGTAYVQSTKNPGVRSRLLPYIFNVDQSYVVELGAGYARFFTGEGALIVDDSLAPVEVVTPYTAEQLAQVKYTQGADTMLLFHPDVPTQRLQRLTATTWGFGPAPWVTEPFSEQGHTPDAALTLSSGAVGAGRTFTTVAVTNPDAPTIGTATALNGGARVTFSPPLNTGGRPIIRYDVTSSPGGIVGSGTFSPVVVTGLTNGVAYTFTVTAVTDYASSPPSAASNSVTPNAGAPSPTISVSAPNLYQEVGNGPQTVFGPAASVSGATPPVNYTWTKTGGGGNVNITNGTGASAELVSNASNNTTFCTLHVEAVDANGARGSADCNMTTRHQAGSGVPI